MSYTTRTERVVAAPREQVYDALVDPNALTRWRVPNGMTGEVHAFEPVEGGEIRVSLTYDDATSEGKSGGRTDTYSGRFARLVRGERVEERIEFEGDDPRFAGAMTVRIVLSDDPAGTRVTAEHEGVPDAVPRSINETAWNASLDRLARVVEAPDARPSARLETGDSAPHASAIVSSRVFPHAIDHVFTAFEDPSVLSRWWGPAGFRNRFETFEFRPGGRWALEMTGPDRQEYVLEKTFLEIDPGRRIVLRHEQAGHEFTMTMVFEPASDGTRVVWTMAFDSAAEAERVGDAVRSANDENFDRLAVVLGPA